MNAIQRFRFRNTLIVANIIANVIGVSIAMYLFRRTGIVHFPLLDGLLAPINLMFIPISFLLPTIAALIYERPIRAYLAMRYANRSVPAELAVRCRRRLLNEPFFLLAVNALVWTGAAITYAAYYGSLGSDSRLIWGAFSLNLQVGMVSVTVAFFVIEFFLRRRLAPYFFPSGGMSRLRGTIHIRIRTRMIALLAAINLIPMITLARGSWTIGQSIADPGLALAAMQEMSLSHAVIFAWVGIWLAFLVSSNLVRPLADMTAALGRIRDGQFDTRVSVTTNDELGYVGDAINEMAAGLQEREIVKETFGKYVSEAVRDKVLSGSIPLDGEMRDVTVLFADLRNFTPLVEQTSPQQVVRMINRYFEEMEAAISARGGLVLQYIGDEIEAVFGAPLALDDHATLAVEAAMTMNAALETVNRELVDAGHPPLQHGIGIHSGKVVAATIGSPDRLSYALVGDTVNVASRLQDVTKRHGTPIIVSAETHRRLTRPFPLQPLPDTLLKGKRKPARLFGC
jgi:adenylate cyclase